MKKKFVDSILPFQVDSNNLRGRFARVERVTSDILKNHHSKVYISHFIRLFVW